MKRTCRASRFFSGTKPSNQSWIITLTSSRTNTKLVVSKQGHCASAVSVGRSKAYSGYKKREEMAIYKMARGFGRHIRKKLKLKNTRLGLRVRGFRRRALLGMVDGGLRFHWVREVKNPPFNGCRKKKRRRR